MRADTRRVGRRILMFSVGTVAVLAILAALSTVAFRILVAYAPGYRDELSARISEMAGQPVEIGQMDLVWSHWQPTLALKDVTMLRSGAYGVVMHLRSLRLGFSILRAIQGDFVPDRVVMLGPRLTVERGLDGKLRIYGLEKTEGVAAPSDWTAFLRRLMSIHHVAVRDGRVRLSDLVHPEYNGVFDNVHGHVTGTDDDLTGTLSAGLPAAVGGRALIAFTATGERSAPARLRVTGDAVISGVRLDTWLQPYLRPGVDIVGRIDALHVGGVYADGRLQRAAARLAVGPLKARVEVAGKARLQPLFEHLNMKAKWRRNAAGWAVSVSDIDLALGGAGAGAIAPGLGAYVSYRSARDRSPAAATATLPRLPLAALRPWLGILRLPAPDWLARTAPGGELRDVKATWTAGAGAADVVVSGQFGGLSTAPVGRIPGFLGIRGSFEIGPGGGHARLHSRGGVLRAPTLFGRPLPIAKLDARLIWERTPGGWHVHCPKLGLETLDARASGKFDMDLPTDAPPVIDLSAAFAADSVPKLRPFVPLILPPKVQHWLISSITAGRVSDGHLVIKGALRDFPFVGKPGEFDVDFQVRGGGLAYADDWPAISNIAAHLKFHGLSMDLKTTQGRMIGVPLGPVTARIEDFRDAMLKITGRAGADLSRQFAFLAESPLRDHYQGLLDALEVGGPAEIKIDLAMPLKDIDRTQVSGEITLKGDRIVYHEWPQPFTGVTGTLHFSRDGLVAKGLRARMQGLDLTVDLAPATGDPDRTQLTATTLLQLPLDRGVVAPYVPALLLDRLFGSSRWRLSLSFSRAAAPGDVVLMSDLAGTTVNLPVPLAKPAMQGMPVSVTIGPANERSLQVHVAASGLFDALISLSQTQSGDWLFDRGLIRMGGAPAVLSPRPGLWVDGHVATADMSGWLNFVRAIGGTGDGTAVAGNPLFRGVDLLAGKVIGFGQQWRNVQLNLSRESGGWLMTLASLDVDGTIHVQQPADASARLSVTADMARMRLRLPTMESATGSGDGEAQPLDPKSLPALSLRCAACTFNGLQPGRLTMQVDALPDGVALRKLDINGDEFNLGASGKWTRAAGRSTAALSAHLETGHLQALVKALGYTPGVKAQKSTLKSDLKWAPAASGLSLANLGGSLSMKLDDGVLLAVDPGAGRVLGLLNFYTLPRRLMLNFSDVMDKGLAFDRIRGRFTFRNGSAYTHGDGLTLEGPSLRMVMKGRVGLVAQDYDEDITVYPQIGSAVPIAGAVIGGPAVGALLLLAQHVLGQPLAQLTKFGYHVGGTWADPEVTSARSPTRHESLNR